MFGNAKRLVTIQLTSTYSPSSSIISHKIIKKNFGTNNSLDFSDFHSKCGSSATDNSIPFKL